MTPLPMTRLLLLFALVLTIQSCSFLSRGASISPAEVAGLYSVEEFTFRPEGSALRPVNVLDQFDRDKTSFQIFANNRVTFEYALKSDGLARAASGTYALGRDVRVDFASSDRGSLDDLIVPRSLTLSGDGQTLRGEVERDGVDVSPFSDAYAGVGRVDGTYIIRLRRVQAPR